MKVTIIGSDSKENGYIIEHEGEAIIIECGFPFSHILKKINYETKKIKGVLLTHEHMDHAKYTKTYLDSSKKVYMSNGTATALKLENHRNFCKIKDKTVFTIGNNFKILPFSTYHDVSEPLGFLINVKGYGNTVFITDSYLMPFKIDNVRFFMVECNYIKELILNTQHSYNKRVLTSHSGLAETLSFLKRNVSRGTSEDILILHLSKNNSNEVLIKSQIQKETGLRTTIAKKDSILYLDDF